MNRQKVVAYAAALACLLLVVFTAARAFAVTGYNILPPCWHDGNTTYQYGYCASRPVELPASDTQYRLRAYVCINEDNPPPSDCWWKTGEWRYFGGSRYAELSTANPMHEVWMDYR